MRFADFDLLVGGFPCQPFSVAGKRLGTADKLLITIKNFRNISER
ncbi:MAG: DNA cytosine methyltransferase [Oscillospiraceae bacterium]|nr:DNA cytosine methyltransferase [Oscillospiraceae bacterium]